MKGSPPHMRGKGKSLCDDLQRVGITPAYAGKSTAGAAFDRAVEDHPRICGEKVYRALSPDFHQGSPPHMRKKWSITSTFSPLAGSPPHMRGKDSRVDGCPPQNGITPAYAGKRNGQSKTRQTTWDHPRICGEKLSHSQTSPVRMGSPPHMRGKESPVFSILDLVRITPAYAGKSVWKFWTICAVLGSPPHMRGKD